MHLIRSNLNYEKIRKYIIEFARVAIRAPLTYAIESEIILNLIRTALQRHHRFPSQGFYRRDINLKLNFISGSEIR